MKFVGYNEPAVALFAEIVAGRRLPEVDALLGRRPAGPTGPLRRCRAECGRDLPVSEFSPCRNRRPDGLYPYCRECTAARYRAKRASSPEIRERDKARKLRERAERKARGGGLNAHERELARERQAARAYRVAKENPAYGVCVVCRGPVAKRLQRQRKTCEKPECVRTMKSAIAKALRSGRSVKSYEEAIGGAA